MSGEADSWDDSVPQDEPVAAVGNADGGAEEAAEAAAAPQEAAAPQPPKLNPSAASFSFNPTASTFTPGGAAGAAAAPPAAVSPPPRTAPPAAGEADRRADAGVDEVTAGVRNLPADAKKKDEPPPDDFEDDREHVNLVFIGHVDAGKSTIGGQILFLTGSVDERLIAKYEREAKEKNRESWYMAYIMDTNEEERAKGKTVEVGRAQFETPAKRYTILDAPGHKNYVPNMIAGAAQADVGVLVISSRKGEFETGFERGGQTREHAQLAKTLGVAKLVVVVNKMDDPSVQWDQGRFEEVQTKLTPFLKQCGYNTKRDVHFLPISGLLGTGMKARVPKDLAPWHDGPSLFECLDNLEPQERSPDAPFRMPLVDKYKEDGKVWVMGKTEAGVVRRGDALLIMPNRSAVKVLGVFRDAQEVGAARPGENIRLRLAGVEEEEVAAGFVVCSQLQPVPVVTQFDALLSVLELLDHKSIFTAGYTCVMHIHTATEECEVVALHHQIDPKTKEPIKKKCLFLKSGSIALVRIQLAGTVCLERFKDFPQLGRFTLRDEGRTIAIGKVERIRDPNKVKAAAVAAAAGASPAAPSLGE